MSNLTEQLDEASKQALANDASCEAEKKKVALLEIQVAIRCCFTFFYYDFFIFFCVRTCDTTITLSYYREGRKDNKDVWGEGGWASIGDWED